MKATSYLLCILALTASAFRSQAEIRTITNQELAKSLNWSHEKSRMDASITLLDSFIGKLQSNTPFTYEDEQFYFGFVGESVSMLMDLGYMNEAGSMIQDAPHYSYIGELVRQHRDLLLQEGKAFHITLSNYEALSDGRYPKSEIQEEKGRISKTYAETTFIETTIRWRNIEDDIYDLPESKREKTLTLKVMSRDGRNKASIYLNSIYINGKALMPLLGFKLRDETHTSKSGKVRHSKIPYLPQEKLQQLQEHINGLEATGG